MLCGHLIIALKAPPTHPRNVEGNVEDIASEHKFPRFEGCRGTRPVINSVMDRLVSAACTNTASSAGPQEQGVDAVKDMADLEDFMSANTEDGLVDEVLMWREGHKGCLIPKAWDATKRHDSQAHKSNGC